jgi:hypothetical protein
MANREETEETEEGGSDVILSENEEEVNEVSDHSHVDRRREVEITIGSKSNLPSLENKLFHIRSLNWWSR